MLLWMRMPLFSVAVSLMLASCCLGALITDGFEGTSPDPAIWTKSGVNAPTSPGAVYHEGARSLMVAFSANNMGSVNLAHAFDGLQSGTVSVWVYETDFARSTELRLTAAGTDVAAVGSWNYDLDYYHATAGTTDYASVSRSSYAWHHLQMTADAAHVEFRIDGTLLGSASGDSRFDSVSLSCETPLWGQSPGAVYFDEFSASTVPEPAAAALLLGIALIARRQRA